MLNPVMFPAFTTSINKYAIEPSRSYVDILRPAALDQHLSDLSIELNDNVAFLRPVLRGRVLVHGQKLESHTDVPPANCWASYSSRFLS